MARWRALVSTIKHAEVAARSTGTRSLSAEIVRIANTMRFSRAGHWRTNSRDRLAAEVGVSAPIAFRGGPGVGVGRWLASAQAGAKTLLVAPSDTSEPDHPRAAQVIVPTTRVDIVSNWGLRQLVLVADLDTPSRRAQDYHDRQEHADGCADPTADNEPDETDQNCEQYQQGQNTAMSLVVLMQRAHLRRKRSDDDPRRCRLDYVTFRLTL